MLLFLFQDILYKWGFTVIKISVKKCVGYHAKFVDPLDNAHKYTHNKYTFMRPPFPPTPTITATHTHRSDHVSSSSTSHVWLHPEQTISKVLSSWYHSLVSYYPLVPCGASILIMELQGEHPGVPNIACNHGNIIG